MYRLALKKLNVSLVSATEKTDNSPSGKFLTTLLSAVAELDNDVRAERTVSGMRSRLTSGRWQWPAPLGYLNGAKDGPSLVIDPQRGPLILAMFELVSKGHQKASALAIVTQRGLRAKRGGRINQETAGRILTNPIYTGEIVSAGWGIAVRGDFEPLVPQALFDKVQNILSGKSPVAVPHARDREDFPLRGLILCSECMKPVTASISTGKLGNKFGYYRCHRAAGHLNTKREIVEAGFSSLLDSMVPSAEDTERLRDALRTVWQERHANSANEAESLRRELGRLKARKERLLSQLADGVIEVDDFKRMSAVTAEAMAATQSQLDSLESISFDEDDAINYLEHVLWNTRNSWENADLQEKQRLKRKLFPNGIPMSKEGFGAPLKPSIYMGLATNFKEGIDLASPTGFEPVLPP